MTNKQTEEAIMKTKQQRAEYMKNYRKSAHYIEVELPKHRIRNRLNSRKFRNNARNNLVEQILEKVGAIGSTYLHQRDFIERTETLKIIKEFQSDENDRRSD